MEKFMTYILYTVFVLAFFIIIMIVQKYNSDVKLKESIRLAWIENKDIYCTIADKDIKIDIKDATISQNFILYKDIFLN